MSLETAASAKRWAMTGLQKTIMMIHSDSKASGENYKDFKWGPTQAKLAESLERHTRGHSDLGTQIPELCFFRREAPTPPALCQVETGLILVVQGAKRLLVGEDAFAYDSERFLITSLDLPASTEVITASHQRPCLGLLLKLDLQAITELVAQAGSLASKDRPVKKAVALGEVNLNLLLAFERLVSLLDEPEALPVLAPLYMREIHYRLLQSDQASRLRQLAQVGSQSHLVAKAIEWLKLNYRSPFRVEELAERVHMSSSNLHHHFRQLTAMSPLQYQKRLRLTEARRLMLSEGFDAARAAFEVGYESPSQFSREYGRLFGFPPKKDIHQLLQRVEAPPRLSYSGSRLHRS